MKKILITGCSGYIGSHLINYLKKDYIIHGIDMVDTQVNPNSFLKTNINHRIHIEESYDAVVHLAALVSVGESERIPIMYYITNTNGTMNMCKSFKTKNFIFASTGAAEHCLSPYGVSKRAAEDVVKEYFTQHDLKDFTIFRFYNVIGSAWGLKPTNPDGLFYNLIKAKESGEFTIYGKDYHQSHDGTCVRDYVHVLEICNAIKLAIEKPSNKIECLGHGVGYSVKEIVEIFQEVNDVDFKVKYGPRRKGDLPYSVLENTSTYMKELFKFKDLWKI